MSLYRNQLKDKIENLKQRAGFVKFSDGGNYNSIQAIDLIKELLDVVEKAGDQIATLQNKVHELSKNTQQHGE